MLPDDVAFDLRGRDRAVWTNGDQRLARIRSEGVDAVVALLGGTEVPAHLRRTHQQLGASLGVSKPLSAPLTSARQVAAPLVTAQATMREYVVKVIGAIDPAAPGSDAMAAALLSPLLDAARVSAGASKSKSSKAAKRLQTPAQPVTPNVPTALTPANDTAPAVRPTGTG